MGWACDPKRNAVLTALKHAFEWRSTKRWQNTKAIEMTNDPFNHTRWKHTWGLHNRGCVRDKVARMGRQRRMEQLNEKVPDC